VVGVAPPHFQGTIRGLAADFWIPLGLYHQTVKQLGQGARGPLELDRGYEWLFVTARLKPGVSRASAQAALRTIEASLDHAYRQPNRHRDIQLEPADSLPLGLDRAKRLLGMMTIVAALVLLVACANVANLLLARAAARNQEIGVRLAIGAGRARLIRQLLAESTLLSTLGALFGMALAWVATRALGSLQSAFPYPVTLDLTMDWRVLTFTATVALATGIVFGLAPAIKGTRQELTSLLKAEPAGFAALRRFGLKNGLVVAQIAVSVVLLVAAVQFVESLRQMSSIPIGMDPRNVLVLRFDPRAAGYSNERAELLFGSVLDRVRALPNVASAGLVDTLPLSMVPHAVGVARPSTHSPTMIADIYGVTSQYFGALRIPLVRGRDFDLARRPAFLPAIVNEAIAARLFPGEDAVGGAITWEGIPHTIVAVAANAKSTTVSERTQPQIFVPLEYEYPFFWGLSGVALTVRTVGPPSALIGPIRNQFLELDAALPVYDIETMSAHIDGSLVVPRVCGSLFGVFGAVALTLAAVGLYGVMTYAAQRRTKEIGIHLAIGARRVDVARLLARQGIWLTVAGLALGLTAAWPVSHGIGAFLYGVDTRDSAVFAGVSILLAATALVAIAIPAIRAARMDALRAIHYE
jgi:predicted permease